MPPRARDQASDDPGSISAQGSTHVVLWHSFQLFTLFVGTSTNLLQPQRVPICACAAMEQWQGARPAPCESSNCRKAGRLLGSAAALGAGTNQPVVKVLLVWH